MDKKKKLFISSTPCIGRTQQIMNLLTDIQCSPIILPSQSDPVPKYIPPPSKLSEAQKTRVVRKRKVYSKDKAPESTSSKVLNELGIEAQDIGNSVLSHSRNLSRSRNLYSMFPEPIILDSDEEISFIAKKKPLKKRKQDSKDVQSGSSKNGEENKPKQRVPGSSRTSRLAKRTVDGQSKKQSSIQSNKSAPTTSKDLRSSPKNKPVNSILNDDDDDVFPDYIPGTFIFPSNSRVKISKKHRLSLELDEKFPIEWSSKPRKRLDDKAMKDSELETVESVESKEKETNNIIKQPTEPSKMETKRLVESNSDKDEKTVIKKSNSEKETVTSDKEIKRRLLHKPQVLSGSQSQCIGNKNTEKHSPLKEIEEKHVLVSCFKDIVFKPRRNSGGVVARCLKTEENDIGYLEVSANETFSGKSNTTFVVIEGEAKVTSLGEENNLSAGDMIHINDSAGYELRASGSEHVRFLYIKAL